MGLFLEDIMNDFIREKLCFYTNIIEEENSSWQIVKSAAKHGVAGVEFMNFSTDFTVPDMKFAKEIGGFAKKNGLKMPCFSVGVNFYDNPTERLNYVKGYADICSELEIPYLHHTMASSLKYDEVKDKMDEITSVAYECALEVNDYAKKRGVQTLVEEQGFIFNGQRYLEFVEKTKDKIGTCFDFGNICFVDELPENLLKNMPVPNHVHIKDYHIKEEKDNFSTIKGMAISQSVFGEGDVNVRLLAKMLKEKGYNGYFAYEGKAFKNDDEVRKGIEKISEIMCV